MFSYMSKQEDIWSSIISLHLIIVISTWVKQINQFLPPTLHVVRVIHSEQEDIIELFEKVTTHIVSSNHFCEKTSSSCLLKIWDPLSVKTKFIDRIYWSNIQKKFIYLNALNQRWSYRKYVGNWRKNELMLWKDAHLPNAKWSLTRLSK